MKFVKSHDLFDIDRGCLIVDRGCLTDNRPNEHADIDRLLRAYMLPSYFLGSRKGIKTASPSSVGE